MRYNKLNLVMLVAIGLGAVIGTGIFSAPTNMAKIASPFAICISWVITTLGIMSIAYILKMLSTVKPNIKGGLVGYATELYGDFAGAMTNWGYCICAIFTLMACYIAIGNVLIYFFQIFNLDLNDYEPLKLMINSLTLWGVATLISGGVEETGLTSVITTICKIVPILLLIIFIFLSFDKANFTYDFYGESRSEEIGSLFTQVRKLMGMGVWLIVGFESISMISARAGDIKDVGKSIIITVVISLIIYILISLGSLGVLTRKELLELPSPSTAYILSSIIGNRGEIIINFAILISAIGVLVSWTFVAVEVIYRASKNGLFFSFTAKEVKDSPNNAIMLISAVIQVIFLINFFSPKAYEAMYLVAINAVLIPFLFTTVYAVKLVKNSDIYESKVKKNMDLSIAIVALAYMLWLIHAIFFDYLVYVNMIYAAGIVVYAICTKINKKKAFNKVTGSIATVVLIFGFISIFQIYFI